MKFWILIFIFVSMPKSFGGGNAPMMFHPLPIPGFFVLSSVTFAANMGGLAGANSNCLTDLTNTSWKGKAEAKLDASHVFAFLCDGSTCNNLLPNTRYQ